VRNIAQQGEQIGLILNLYHETAQEGRHLRRAITDHLQE